MRQSKPQLSEMLRETYGPTDPVTGAGGIEYRFQYPEPDWDASEKTLGDLGDLLNEFNGWGRKRTVKRKRLRELLTDWPETDAYLALRALLRRPFPHPAHKTSVERDAVYGALADAFGPEGAGVSWGEDIRNAHANTTMGVKTEILGPADTDPTLGEVFGKWLYTLAEESRSTEHRTLLATMLRDTASPWVLVDLLTNSLTLYFGVSAARKAMTSLLDPDLDHTRGCRVMGDTAAYWLACQHGTARDTLQPHDSHKTMKANSTNIDKINEPAFDRSQWRGQTKYDGARLFVHHAGDGDVRYYSSGMRDVTKALPELDTIDWPDVPFIFDGEATPYDADGNVVSFENIMTRLTRVGDAIDPDAFETDVVFKMFDCPYWKGEDITKRPFSDRFAIVRAMFDPDNVARTGTDLDRCFETAVSEGHEGLVLKRVDAEYQPGGRHSQWLKWKQAAETLDVVVVDALSGSGKFADTLGAVKVAVQYEGEHVTIGRVGSGFTDAERDALWADYECGDLYGMTIEIEFEDLQYSGKSFGLRFPRFKRQRPDGEVDSLKRATALVDREDEFVEWEGELRSVTET